MENIKESFQRVKKDTDNLKLEINYLKKNLYETREKLIELSNLLKQFNQKTDNKIEKIKMEFKEDLISSTHKELNSTQKNISSTHNLGLEPIKTQNLGISIGNQGVSTDRQTDRQTDQHTKNTQKENKNTFENAIEIISSLDKMKKELRLKFKRLTNQEMLVFSTLYQLEEEKGQSDYQSLAQKIGLTESSIRDYIGRLIKKGIPVDKTKINNKSIKLSISINLKKIASLSTILQLRDL